MKRLHRLLLLALGLIVVALAVNLTDPTHSLARLVKGETKIQAQYAQHFTPGKPIPPIGSETAKVKIKVFVQTGNQCHEPTISFFQKVGEALPSRIRIVFVDSGSKEGFEAKQKAGIGCESGILINDQKDFEVERDGKKVPISTGGPIGMEVPPASAADLIKQVALKQYGKALTKEEIAKLDTAWKPTAPPTPEASAKEEQTGSH